MPWYKTESGITGIIIAGIVGIIILFIALDDGNATFKSDHITVLTNDEIDIMAEHYFDDVLWLQKEFTVTDAFAMVAGKGLTVKEIEVDERGLVIHLWESYDELAKKLEIPK